jgi:transcriptional regulator with XRE-family HTH domain
MKVFASRLKTEREKRKKNDPKWTQEYVADLIGVARPTYTAYENGTKQPPLETVNNIADLLDVSSDYLLGRSDDPSPNQPSIAYYGGAKTEEEKEFLDEQLEIFRRIQAKREQEKK